jgi:hypothetical protein
VCLGPSFALAACSGSPAGSAEDGTDAAITTRAVTSALKKFDPSKPPAEFGGTVPSGKAGLDARAANLAYTHDNFLATYQAKAGTADIYLVVGNIVDADYEMAVFDAKGSLVTSGQWHGFQAGRGSGTRNPTSRATPAAPTPIRPRHRSP